MNGNDWQVIGICLGIMAAWSVIIITALRVMFARWERRLDEKIDTLNKLPESVQALEKDFLRLQADLPLSYVRREDYIRFDTVTNVKLDRMHDLIGQIWKEKNNGL